MPNLLRLIILATSFSLYAAVAQSQEYFPGAMPQEPNSLAISRNAGQMSGVPAPPLPQASVSSGILRPSQSMQMPPPGSPSLVASPDSVAPSTPAQCVAARECESTWYTRVDYFHWNESIRGDDFVNEDGTLLSVGHVFRYGPERFRVELFGGTMHYDGCGQYNNGVTEPFSDGRTGYIGVRGEGELLIEPDWWPKTSFFLGVGSRFWVRDLKDGYSDYGNPIWGYQETWWTIYPYIGMEKKRTIHEGLEFYAGGRVGLTAATYQHVAFDDVSLYPKAGLIGQLEGGIRGQSLFLSAFFESMSWGESDEVRGYLQPASTMLTLGIRAGFTF
jgi:hypothetical protein